MATTSPAKGLSGCGVLLAWAFSLFVGFILVAVAGGAIYPPLISLAAAPVLCRGEFSVESTQYTTEEGGVGIDREFFCQNEPGGPKTEVTLPAIGIAGLIYSTPIFIVLLIAIALGWVRAGRVVATPAAAGAPSPAPAVATADDPADRLRQLNELRQGGVISQEEYEAKKAEILAKL
ncbi:MAG: SHOCT domain-containing protein [Chloroflexi bacterium]|nr:SHOCT domain-containing protein [Chloroflexota bacterium]MCI0577220.1 SHOCT domain-containing protein [Chloroflexota bacterium]MCI0647511.1 SHOCT domain-containing protein [Chloroflexota bacterium]MCI0729143.1 SHOCT domain-containing protein [Chloroflexota bacterium]